MRFAYQLFKTTFDDFSIYRRQEESYKLTSLPYALSAAKVAWGY